MRLAASSCSPSLPLSGTSSSRPSRRGSFSSWSNGSTSGRTCIEVRIEEPEGLASLVGELRQHGERTAA